MRVILRPGSPTLETLDLANRLANRLSDAPGGDSVVIAAGVRVLGRPIDLLVARGARLTIVQRIAVQGPIQAEDRGCWRDSTGELLPGQPNPLQSLRLARLGLADWLAERAPAVLGRHADNLNLPSATGLVAADPVRHADSSVRLSGANWCRVVGADRLAGDILRSRRSPADPAAIEALFDDLVGAPDRCFLCLPHADCDLWRISGTVETVTASERGCRLWLRTADYWPVEIYLNYPWQRMAAGLSAMIAAGARPALAAYHLRVRSHDGGLRLATVPESIVVLEPSRIVSVSDVAAMNDCPMAYLIKQFESDPPNGTMLRGTVVHAALDRVIAGSDPLSALIDAVDDSGLAIALAGSSRDAAYADALPHVSHLEHFAPGIGSARTETEVRSAVLGLAGRTDAIWESDGVVTQMLELKTGKPAHGNVPRRDHQLQAQLYAAMLWQQGRLALAETPVIIGYTGGDRPAALAARIDWPAIRKAILTRNETVLLDLTGIVDGGPRRCGRCAPFRTSGCDDLSDLLGLVDPDPATDDADRRWLRRWTADLRRDAALTAGERAAEARRSFVDRVADGSIQRISAVRSEPGFDGVVSTLAGVTRGTFRPGDRVLLVEDGLAGRSLTADVLRLSAEGLVVRSDEPVSWAGRVEDLPESGGLARRGFQAVRGWLRAPVRMRRVVAGDAPPRFGPIGPADPTLDPAQADAARRALAAEDYLLIWGPPGAGKTRTIARISRGAVALGRRAVLAAFTNQAVDTLAAALLRDGQTDFLVLGRSPRSDPAIDPFTLAAVGGDPVRIREALESARVVLATAHTIGDSRYAAGLGRFDLVILDEASQLPEPLALGAIRLGESFVLVGDHRQLEPIADSQSPLAQSLFDRLWNDPASAGARAMLSRQYRMRAAIAAYPAATWYDHRLETADAAEAQPPIDDDPPAVLAQVDPAQETAVVRRLVSNMVAAGVAPEAIGVVTPSRVQVSAIGRALVEWPGVTVDTVDRYQGSEREAIILALAAVDRPERLITARRLNVALTRAKRKLVVLTSPKVERLPVVADVVRFYRDRGWIRAVQA